MDAIQFILVAFLAVPTLQEESCVDIVNNCDEMTSWCAGSSFVKKKCPMTCGVCTPTVCDPKCVNGACTGPHTCTCKPGWVGHQCQNAVCSSQCALGACTEPNTCTYDPRSEEPQCENYDLNDAICNSLNQDSCKKKTVRDQCKNLCSTDACNINCDNGACTDIFTCECRVDFQGPNCTETDVSAAMCAGLSQNNCKDPAIRTRCKNLCSSDTCTENCLNGICSSTFTCECKPGFQGANCEASVSGDSVSRDGSDCQYPWIYINTNLTSTCVTFLGRLHLTTNIWENARKACQKMGADLPKFTSRNQIDGLYQYLNTWRKHNKQRALHGEHWIRGYRKSDGKSYWADDGGEIPSDLFSKKGYFERRYIPANKTRGPLPTTIEKECLLFRPQPANDDEPRTGIFNNGKTPCDKMERTNAYTMAMCQKYVE